jgi:hypothetical protein
MPKANAGEVTSAFIIMMTKLLPPPAPQKKGKESNAAPCLIDPHPKFARIAKKQPRVTSSSEGPSVSMKGVRFRRFLR